MRYFRVETQGKQETVDTRGHHPAGRTTSAPAVQLCSLSNSGYKSMSPTMLPSAEWLSTTARRAASPAAGGSRSSPEQAPSGSSNAPQPATPAGAAGAAGATGGPEAPPDGCRHDINFSGHRGSGGLVSGKAVFCLPPDVEWFQGHFAYAARGGCTASLGVLGTELPVDPVSYTMQAYLTCMPGVHVLSVEASWRRPVEMPR